MAAGAWPAFPDCAARLAALIPRERLDAAVVGWTEVSSRRTPWGIAFSGGADSLALLLLVWAHWPERRRRLRVLHFDHRLRGGESRADAAFCRRVAQSLDVSFELAAWTDAAPDSNEAEIRAARMRFLETSRVVWFGHHQDDVAETMLMRLARGSGSGGLAAPRPIQLMPRQRVHLRPMIGLKKGELVHALHSAGAIWREDSSNEQEDYFRNRIRRNVLPNWAAAANRDAVAGAARSRQLLEEDDIALEAWLDELAPLAKRGVLSLNVLSGKPRALLRRALHRWLLQQKPAADISRQAFEALLAALEKGRATRHSLGRHGFAVTDGVHLRFEPVRKFRRKFHRTIN